MVSIQLLQGEPLRDVWRWERDNLPEWTEEEFVTQHSAFPWVCWGVYVGNELCACFSMEQQPDKSVRVHVSSNRKLPFNVLKKIAKGCADGLIGGGIPYLTAETPATARAEIWIAYAAGFHEVERVNGIVRMKRDV